MLNDFLTREIKISLSPENYLVLNQLTENYKDIFYFSNNSANEIAVDILEEISNASSNN